MRIIIEHHNSNNIFEYVTVPYLCEHGFKDEELAIQTVEVLHSMGYIAFRRTRDNKGSYIVLTDRGRSYFEEQSDERAQIRKQQRHDWLIAIFSALAGALASEPIWNLIHSIFGNKTP